MAKKYGYEAYLEDKKKREEEAKKGQVRYVEAAQASRPQYTLPQYQGKSQNQGKTYQWERDLMADTKIKGAGNSYTKKFDALTSSMGMTPGQAEEFRKYMDFQEDSQHVDPKLNKDGTIKQNQSLKYARDARLKTDLIDSILDNMHKTGAKQVQTASNPVTPKKKDNGFVKGLMKVMEVIDRPGDAVRTGIKEKAEGRSFWEGAKDGFTGEKNTSGTELNKLIGLDPEKNEGQRDISKVINSNILNTFGVGMAVNALTPDKAKDYAATQTPGAATETLLDPLNLLGGGASKGVRESLSLPAQMAKVLDATKSVRYSDDVLQNALKEAYAPKGNPSNVLADTPNPLGEQAQQVLNDMLKSTPTPNQNNFSNDAEGVLRQLLGEDAPKAPVETNPLDSFTPNEIPKVEMPESLAPKDAIYDQLNFGQSSKYAPKARKDLTPAERSLDPMNRPQSYWKERYEGFADQLQKQGYNPNNLSKESLDELWGQYAKYDEPVSLENAVDLAYGNGPQSKLNTDPGFDPAQRLDELLKPPLKINDWQKNAYPKDQLNGDYGQADVSGLDEMLALLQGETKSGRTIKNAPTPGLPQNVAELIESFKKNPEIVNNSQVPEPVQPTVNAPKTLEEPVLSTMQSEIPFNEMPLTEVRDLVNGLLTKWTNAMEESAAGKHNVNRDHFEKDALKLREYYLKRKELEGKSSPKADTEAVKIESAPASEVTQGAETSSNMKPLGISAGQPKVNDISWVEEPQNFMDKVKSGKENAGTVGRKLKTEVISDLQPVKDVERSIAGMDEDGVLRTILGSDTNVSAEDSLFKGLRGVRRSVSEAMKAAKEDYGSILKTLRANKISKRDFDEYASAVHFNDVLKNNHDLAVREGEVSARLEEIEKLAQGTNDKSVLKQLADEEKALLKEKSDLEPYKLPASATVENVERILKRWENTPAMHQAQKAFMDAQNKDLDLLVQSGVYSEATANAMKTAHPNYIYMGRAKDEASVLGAGGNSSKPNKFILKRSKGSEENLKYSPLESAVRNRLLTYSNARRNAAMQQIEKLASVKGANQYFNELNPHSASASQMRNSVKFFVDGAEKRYEVPPALKDAFENIDAKNAKDLVDSSLRAVANITRKGATYFNTDFIFSSVFRDANGLITSRTNMHPGELILGYMDSFMGKGLERMSGGKFKSYKGLYEKMGGHQTGFVTLDPQSTKQFMKDIDKGTLGKGIKIIDPRKWPEVITKFGGAIEHGPKLGEFRSAKNKGLGDLDAMHEATEVIDYTDQGSTIRNWNDKIPFLNPAIRGNTRYFQAAKENFPAWMGKNLLYITTPTVGIYMMRFSPTTSEGQRSKLRNMSEYQKNMFWHIPVPNSEKILSIPKMHTAAQLFGNPIERALDLAFGDNPKSVSRILKDTGADSLNVLVPPSAVAGVNQIKNAIANYDPLMDMPIEDIAMQKNPDKTEHYNSFTSEVAKGLGNTFNQSPAKIDYMLKSLTGGTGRDILDLTDNVLAKTGAVERPQKVDTILDILNPTSRYQYKDTSGLETSNELYEQQKRDSFDGNKDSDAVRLYSDMKALNKEIKGIRESTDMTSQEKKEAIAELRAQQRLIGDEAISLGILKNR